MVYKEYSVLKREHKEYSEQITDVDGGIGVEKYLYCCGLEQPCKVYELPTKKAWKRLYFLDVCGLCSQTVASLQECDKDGRIKVLKRCSGKKALELRDKLTLKVLIFDNTKKGTLSSERIYYNDKGIIYNLNNRRLGSQEEFLEKFKGANVLRSTSE